MDECEFVESRFRILDCIPVGVFALKDDFTVVFWNRCLEQWTKINRDEILGHRFDDHFYTLNKPLLRLRLQNIFEGGPPAIFSSQLHQYIVPVVLRSGKMRVQHTIVSAVRDPEDKKFYALFAVQDVTDLTNRIQDYQIAREQAAAEIEERTRVEEELRRQKELFQSVLESLAARIAVLDSQGKILSCNAAWERFASDYGLTHETLGTGANYLQTFLSNSENQRQNLKMYEGLRAVLDGRLEYYQEEYQCHLSSADNWFIMSVTPLVGGTRGAVVAHMDISERKRAEQQIEYLALHDILTDLPNRQLFMDRMTQALVRSKRYRKQAAILYLDLDDFKTINDSLGHQAGDAVLIETARRLKELVRESDTVARIGGDEFAVILLDVQKPADAGLVAEKIARAAAVPIPIGDQQVEVGASIGISMFPKDGTSLASLLKCADSAMYVAKGLGKRSYSFYSQEPVAPDA
ncbi:MAG: diguanylate cyclase [Acidobacteria bacterium]|nr:MAG: diguanylate cyclase [Acidobacteriota bacterium]